MLRLLKQIRGFYFASELYRLSDRRLSANASGNFRGYKDVA
jgi:hypothetical protein